MPKFPEYEAPASDVSLRPTETGIDAFQQAARRIGAFYSQAAEDVSATGRTIGNAVQVAGDQAVKFEVNREITAGGKNFATMVANKTDEWNRIAATADPNDPTVKQRFLESMEPDLEKFANQGFLTEDGKRWAREHVDQFRLHMAQKTTADTNRIAGEAARANSQEMVNQYSNAVYKDASDLDNTIKFITNTINAQYATHPVGGESSADRIKHIDDSISQVVKSAAIGIIRRSGKLPDWVDDPKYSKYISKNELDQFVKAAQVQQRTDRAMQREEEREAREQKNSEVRIGANKIFNDNVTFDPASGKVRINPQFFQDAIDLVHKHGDADNAATTGKTLIDWGENEQKDASSAVVSDPAVRADLMGRMGDKDKPTSEIEILRARADNRLSRQDTSDMLALQKALTDRPEGESMKAQRKQFLTRYEPMIDAAFNQAVGSHSVLGSQKMYEFEMALRDKEKSLIQQGKDPTSLYRPNSPDFFGAPENIANYRVSLADAQKHETLLKKMDEARAARNEQIRQQQEADRVKKEKEDAAKVVPKGFNAPDDWSWNGKLRQYRDPQGNLYDAEGKPVKKPSSRGGGPAPVTPPSVTPAPVQ